MYSRFLICLAALISLGITSYNHIHTHSNLQQWTLAERPDRLTEVIWAMSEKAVQPFDPDRVVQIGAFRLEPNALALKGKLSALINKPVIINKKDGYFKVQLTGFTSQEEIEMLLPTFGLFGIKNIWVIPEKKQEEVKPQVVVLTDTTHKFTTVNLVLPAIAELKPFMSRPTFSLQVGVFHNRAKAMRAQKRITSRLNLPVRIIQEWEYYKVLVTGFLSMEETFIYYPRLTDMGYPNITLTEAY
jgi:hypothetical protein